MPEYEAYYRLFERAESDMAKLFGCIVLLISAVFIPLYRIVMSERKERRRFESELRALEDKAESAKSEQYIKREARIIQVITQNTEVITELKTALENSGASTANSLTRIHERIDAVSKSTENISREVEIIKSFLSNVNSPNG